MVTEVTADQYLSYAELDISAGTSHGAINALGNAKRALHLMIDTVLQNYGMLACNQANFPAKLRLLDRVGLISLSVFDKLNVERNVVEHEYSAPLIDRVQDFIDVCRLLRLALERLGQDVPYRVIAGIRETGEHVLLELEPLLGQLTLRPLIDPFVRKTMAFGRPTEFVLTTRGSVEAADIAEHPSKTLQLRVKNVDEWAPIVNCLVEHQGRSGRVTRIDHDMVTIWTSMTIPAESFRQSPMAELFAARIEHEEAETDELSGLHRATTSVEVEFPNNDANAT